MEHLYFSSYGSVYLTKEMYSSLHESFWGGKM